MRSITGVISARHFCSPCWRPLSKASRFTASICASSRATWALRSPFSFSASAYFVGGSDPPRLGANANIRGCARSPSLPDRTLDNILFSHGAFQRNGSVCFQLADNCDDLLLRDFDLFDSDGSESLNIFFHHFRGAGGHGGEEVFFELFGGAFEGKGQTLAIHSGEDFLKLVDVNQQQILEEKHKVPDGFDQIGILLFDHIENFLGRAGIEPVEHLRNRAHAAVGFAAEFTDRL